MVFKDKTSDLPVYVDQISQTHIYMKNVTNTAAIIIISLGRNVCLVDCSEVY